MLAQPALVRPAVIASLRAMEVHATNHQARLRLRRRTACMRDPAPAGLTFTVVPSYDGLEMFPGVRCSRVDQLIGAARVPRETCVEPVMVGHPSPPLWV